MRKRILGALLCLCMIMAWMPVKVQAAAEGITLTDATYYTDNNNNVALKSVETKFGWGTGSANSRLVLMTNKLRSAGEVGTNSAYGDFTNFGYYGGKFSTFDGVINYDTDNNTFGIVSYTDEINVERGSSNNITFNFEETDILLNVDKTYYVYLWTRWSQGGSNDKYYPDNLFCVIRVQDGVVKYTIATGQNDYDENDFKEVIGSCDVTITPTANMTKSNESGAEIQSNLTTAMTPVVYTADEGYYFPEDYAVATVNGIMVKRDSESQITVYGTPTADTAIVLTAPTEMLEHIEFGYAYDVQRSPSFPEKNGTVRLSGLDKPLVNGSREEKDTNEGAWTLTKVGTYSYMKHTGTGNDSLPNIVDAVASKHDITDSAKEGIVIHELKDGNTHIAYGIVIVFDEVNGYAAFVGDVISGSGAGYLLSKTALNNAVTLNATTVATDFVPTITYSIELDPNSTITFDAVREGEVPPAGKQIKVRNTGNGETGEMVISLSGTNADSFSVDKRTLPSLKVNDGVDEQHINSFVVQPKENLPIGTHTATIHVSGQNIVSQTIDVTFTVNEAPHVCTLTPKAKVDAGCSSAGKEAYYHCDVCGKNYEDSNGQTVIADILTWGNIKESGHTPSEWKSDAANHWKECTVADCGIEMERAGHEFEWKTDKEATETENGSKHEECKVCSYKKASVDILATGADVEEEPEEEETTQIVEMPAVSQPPQTGDGNMMKLWVLMIIISGVSVITLICKENYKK